MWRAHNSVTHIGMRTQSYTRLLHNPSRDTTSNIYFEISKYRYFNCKSYSSKHLRCIFQAESMQLCRTLSLHYSLLLENLSHATLSHAGRLLITVRASKSNLTGRIKVLSALCIELFSNGEHATPFALAQYYPLQPALRLALRLAALTLWDFFPHGEHATSFTLAE